MALAFLLGIIFQITIEELYLKNQFLEHVRVLMHYFPRTYTCFMLENSCKYSFFTLNNLCIPPKVVRIKKLQGIQWNLQAIGGFPTNSPTIAHLPTKKLSFCHIKGGIGVSFHNQALER
jgi:hypothetical protein